MSERIGTDSYRQRTVLLPDLDGLSRGLWDDDAPRDRRGLREAVRCAVATALTTKQREVVEAYFFEGLSQGEIARRLGVSQQVVQKRLYGVRRDHRAIGGALRRLHDVLSPLVEP